MRKLAVIVAFASLVVILGSVAIVSAQDELLAGLLKPVVVSIEQAVPVEVTLALPIADGTIITTTTPLTVGVAVQVKIDGAQVVDVNAFPVGAPHIEVAEIGPGGKFTDSAGTSYSVDAPDVVSVGQVQSVLNVFDSVEIVGEITNTSDEPMERLEIIATMYDGSGAIVGADSRLVALDIVNPGQTSPFRIPTQLARDELASYRIQVEP